MKLQEQAEMREMVRRTKEERRQQAASKKQADLDKKLSEQGMTMKDIDPDYTESTAQAIPTTYSTGPVQPKAPNMNRQFISTGNIFILSFQQSSFIFSLFPDNMQHSEHTSKAIITYHVIIYRPYTTHCFNY